VPLLPLALQGAGLGWLVGLHDGFLTRCLGCGPQEMGCIQDAPCRVCLLRRSAVMEVGSSCGVLDHPCLGDPASAKTLQGFPHTREKMGWSKSPFL
jgi:hypothetical protein